jgi:hypothetical protein
MAAAYAPCCPRYAPVPIGPPEVVADHIQEWFEAGAADGYWINPDIFIDGMDAFIDGVIPILQERGLFRTVYEGETLREHLGVDYQQLRRGPALYSGGNGSCSRTGVRDRRFPR